MMVHRWLHGVYNKLYVLIQADSYSFTEYQDTARVCVAGNLRTIWIQQTIHTAAKEACFCFVELRRMQNNYAISSKFIQNHQQQKQLSETFYRTLRNGLHAGLMSLKFRQQHKYQMNEAMKHKSAQVCVTDNLHETLYNDL